jgi:hypothetical protein
VRAAVAREGELVGVCLDAQCLCSVNHHKVATVRLKTLN